MSIPFDFSDNQAFLKVSVNGSQPIWFILDSGASAWVVDATLARKLGLRTEGEKEGTGAGKGTVRFTFAKDVSFSLAGTTIPVDTCYAIDLSNQLTLLGREVGGIIGYDFFTRYVVEVNYEAAVLTLRDPGSFTYSGQGEIVPFTLKKKTPHITAKIKLPNKEPVARELLVDSGSGDAVDDDILAQAMKTLEIVGGVGLGQEFRTILGRAEQLQLGRYVLKEPVGASGGVPLIGTEVLRRFHVIFDYARQRIILEPNGHFNDLFVIDASGLDLRWTPDLKNFAVHDVARKSPAEEAGLREGDLVTAINGQPASAFSIEQVQRLLAQDKKEYRLGLKRGSQQMDVVLRTRTRL